jgi:hypothetical protein
MNQVAGQQDLKLDENFIVFSQNFNSKEIG